MSAPSPFNLRDWIAEHRHLLKPPVANRELAEVGAPIRLRHDVGKERVVPHLRNRQVDAVDRNRIAQRSIGHDSRSANTQRALPHFDDLAYLLDDSSEHGSRHYSTEETEDSGSVGWVNARVSQVRAGCSLVARRTSLVA